MTIRIELDIPKSVCGHVTEFFYHHVAKTVNNVVDLSEAIVVIPKMGIEIPLLPNMIIKMRNPNLTDLAGRIFSMSCNVRAHFVLRTDYGFAIAVLYDPDRFSDVLYRHAVITRMCWWHVICRRMTRLNERIRELISNDFIKVVALYESFSSDRTMVIKSDVIPSSDIITVESKLIEKMELWRSELNEYVRKVDVHHLERFLDVIRPHM